MKRITVEEYNRALDNIEAISGCSHLNNDQEVINSFNESQRVIILFREQSRAMDDGIVYPEEED